MMILPQPGKLRVRAKSPTKDVAIWRLVNTPQKSGATRVRRNDRMMAESGK
jgi:hypothetical protein